MYGTVRKCFLSSPSSPEEIKDRRQNHLTMSCADLFQSHMNAIALYESKHFLNESTLTCGINDDDDNTQRNEYRLSLLTHTLDKTRMIDFDKLSPF